MEASASASLAQTHPGLDPDQIPPVSKKPGDSEMPAQMPPIWSCRRGFLNYPESLMWSVWTTNPLTDTQGQKLWFTEELTCLIPSITSISSPPTTFFYPIYHIYRFYFFTGNYVSDVAMRVWHLFHIRFIISKDKGFSIKAVLHYFQILYLFMCIILPVAGSVFYFILSYFGIYIFKKW